MTFVCRFDSQEHANHTAHILNLNLYKPMGLTSEMIKSLEELDASKFGIIKEKEIQPLDTSTLRRYGYFANSNAWWVVIRY